MDKLKLTGGGNEKVALSEDKKYTNEDLKIMQAWDLQKKIQVSQTRILEWYKAWSGQVYISFSGGKDSTVLADLAARVCKVNGYKLVLWFSDTGLEYPEIREHVKTFGSWLQDKYDIEVETIIDIPKDRRSGKRITFKDVIFTKGYPIVSKEVSKVINDARNAIAKNNFNSYAIKQLNGDYINPKTGLKSQQYNKEKWKFLLDAPFKISNQCCNVMKKRPAHYFEKDSKLKPLVGTMASESKQRETQWLQYGCNAFDQKNPQSKPLSFWTEQDILEYLRRFNIPYASVYGKILQDEKGKYYTTGCNRTGCIFCGFGCHLEKEPNRFQRLKETHPKQWEYCMKSVEEGGLGMREVLDYIGVKVD